MSRVRKHKVILLILIIITVLLAVCAVYLWDKLNLIQYDNEVKENETSTTAQYAGELPDEEETVLSEEDVADLPEAAEAPDIPESEVWDDSNVLNVLLIGTDERSEEFSDNARSDSMILVSLNKKEKTVKLVSFERGMGVPILEGEYQGQYDWLTHVFRYGGASLLTRTIKECFSVDIDHYIRINFNTVCQTIDSIGGVDIELTQEEADYLNTPWSHVDSGDLMTVMAGVNHLDGTTALAYSRIREIDSDWKRVERQRKVIVACIEQLKTLTLSEIDQAANQVLPLIQTDFTKLEIAELLLISPGFFSASIDQMTIPESGTYGSMKGMGNRNLYAVDFEKNAAVLESFLYGNI